MPTSDLNPAPAIRVLLVEGSGVARGLLESAVRAAVSDRVALTAVTKPRDAPEDLTDLAIALVDIDLDDSGSLNLFAKLPAKCWRLATTLYDEEDRVIPALEAGIHGYLLKQDPLERLVESLQRTLRGRPEISAGIARSALEVLRQDGSIESRLEQTLDSLGHGRSVRETARALRITADEVEQMQALVFNLLKHPA